MRIELSQDYLDKHFDGDFAVGCVMTDGDKQIIRIEKFTGFHEIDEEGGQGDDEIVVHFSDDTAMELETLERAVFVEKTLKPISPDWFVELVNGTPEEQETEAKAKAEAERKALVGTHAQQWQRTKALASSLKRPIDALSDTELFAKVLGTPLSVAEEVLTAYDGNLKQMAGSSARELGKIKGIGETRSERLASVFEIGKRLARFHAEREKVTSPSDVADLLMSKMRYLQKEIVVVLALDTKGGVTSAGKAGEDAKELKWGKMLAVDKVFEGTLNSSVFHPREIFRFAIQEAANSVILAHNHPSGDPQPSQEDIRATKQLIEAGNQIGIKVLDHVIIGDGIFVSLKEENFI